MANPWCLVFYRQIFLTDRLHSTPSPFCKGVILIFKAVNAIPEQI